MMSETLNMSMIAELKELMDEDFPLLIDTFLADCEERLVALKAAISDVNTREVRELAHGFKGSSSNLGAETLSEISYTLETMGRTEDLAEADRVYLSLCEEYQQVKSSLNAII